MLQSYDAKTRWETTHKILQNLCLNTGTKFEIRGCRGREMKFFEESYTLQNFSHVGGNEPIFCQTNLFRIPPNKRFMFSYSSLPWVPKSPNEYNHCKKCYHLNWTEKYFHSLQLHSKLVLTGDPRVHDL